MIAKMRKLNLVALSYDRDGILNALQRTNAVEIKEHAAAQGTEPLSASGDELRSYLFSLEAALEILTSAAENFAKDGKNKQGPQKDGFAVKYEEFAAAREQKESMDMLVRTVNELCDKKNACIAEKARLTRAIGAAKPYAKAKLPFSAYADTAHTVTRLGTLSPTAWDGVKAEAEGIALASFIETREEESVLLMVTAHKSAYAEVENLLSGAGFALCPYSGDITGGEQYANLNSQLEAQIELQRETEEELYSLSSKIRALKIYCDYVNFELEKAEVAGKLRGTERTLFLEAFVPAEEEAFVKEALDNSGFTLWYEFSDPAEDEEIPTLLKNNKVVSNFETITNMYSPPNAREMDPNTVMAFFYSLFLGFIMADIGYGILMFIGGGVLWYKSRAGSGIKNLSGVFAVGGIFAILWGVLFNSLFGIQILPFTVLPDAQSQMYTVQGISVPAVLVIAMLLGVFHLLAGYVCKAVQEWRVGNVADGIFDGLTWALFSLGAGIAIAGFVEEFNLPNPDMFKLVGGITAGASLLVAAVTAGRKERLVGKFTKGFGAVYGIINYVSDILSYARLYGLMLSGAIIAQIVSKYSIDFITGGNPAFIAIGVVLMVAGHAFNLAIGLLGAYIHDARLQYVEFYGRFYTGEGELFAPLGSGHKHIYLERS